MGKRGGDPVSISDAIRGFFGRSRIGERVEQAEALAEWPSIVGPQIAAATEVKGVTRDGTLLVRVRTNAWMTELSLREPEIMASLHARSSASQVRRIKWLLWRED